MPEHTTAPWKATGTIVSTEDGWPIANVCESSSDNAEWAAEVHANTNLIAASPELLAACEGLFEFLDHGTPIHPGALVVADMRAAVAKALGR